MRLELAKRPSELLLDAVHLVEKRAAVEIQFSAAQFPIGAEQEMILEQPVLLLIEDAPAHQTEVGNKFLILQPPNGFSLSPGIGLERHSADVFLLGSTLPKPHIASAENGPKYTIARG